LSCAAGAARVSPGFARAHGRLRSRCSRSRPPAPALSCAAGAARVSPGFARAHGRLRSRCSRSPPPAPALSCGTGPARVLPGFPRAHGRLRSRCTRSPPPAPALSCAAGAASALPGAPPRRRSGRPLSGSRFEHCGFRCQGLARVATGAGAAARLSDTSPGWGFRMWAELHLVRLGKSRAS